MRIVFLYTTCPSEEVARRIAHHLLERKRIACANIFPITSVYRWEGEVKNDGEVALIVKTTQKHITRVKRTIESIHPYKVPCLCSWSVSSNNIFGKWVEKETNVRRVRKMLHQSKKDA